MGQGVPGVEECAVTIFGILFDSSDPELPESLLSSDVLMRLRFLSVAPTDPAYLQAVPSTSTTNALEALQSLGTNSIYLALDQTRYRASANESNQGFDISAAIPILPSTGSTEPSLNIILTIEEVGSEATTAAALGWRYSNLVKALPKVESWYSDLSEAVDAFRLSEQSRGAEEDDYWGPDEPMVAVADAVTDNDKAQVQTTSHDNDQDTIVPPIVPPPIDPEIEQLFKDDYADFRDKTERTISHQDDPLADLSAAKLALEGCLSLFLSQGTPSQQIKRAQAFADLAAQVARDVQTRIAKRQEEDVRQLRGLLAQLQGD